MSSDKPPILLADDELGCTNPSFDNIENDEDKRLDDNEVGITGVDAGSMTLVFTKRDVCRPVHIRIIFTKIGDIDTVKETFEASVYLEARWRDPTLDSGNADDLSDIWHPEIYVDNNIGELKQRWMREIVRDTDGELCVVEQHAIKGKFYESMELWHFPFDTQDITVTVCSNLPDSAVELLEMPDKPSRVFESTFQDVQEWELYSHVEATRTTVISDHQIVPRKRPALQFSTRASRRSIFYLVNIWLVSFILCPLALCIFAVDRKLLQGRLQLSFILLLTTVTFKNAIANNIPRVSYQTILDKAVTLNQIFLTLLIIWHTIVSQFPDSASLEQNEKYAVVTFVLLYILSLSGIGVEVFLGAFRRREIMREKDRKYQRNWKALINTVLHADV